MKIKNLLKIGVFSIVILSLLISPILKSITPEANASPSGLVGELPQQDLILKTI